MPIHIAITRQMHSGCESEFQQALNLFIVSILIVTCLTWIVMPRLARWFKPWLNPQPRKEVGIGQQ